MIEHKLPGGDIISHDNRAAVIELNGPRRVLSTSFLNGGFREDLCFLFNFSEVYGVADERCEMRASTNERHLYLIAEELGLNPEKTAGLSTAAKMKYLQIKSSSFDDFTLTAAVTAGIDVSGNRVGDPSSWHEKEGVPVLANFGTINIILHTDALLAPGAMARALSICTEAKTAALQEILAPSCFSAGLATGSGTDGTIVVSRLDSPVQLTNAGTHCKLGEHIGRLVKETVIEALVAENGFKSFTRGSLLKRVSRFGIDEKSLWLAFSLLAGSDQSSRLCFKRSLQEINKNEELILEVTLIGHLVDLLQWQMADSREVSAAVRRRLLQLGLTEAEIGSFKLNGSLTPAELVHALVQALQKAITLAMLRNN